MILNSWGTGSINIDANIVRKTLKIEELNSYKSLRIIIYLEGRFAFGPCRYPCLKSVVDLNPDDDNLEFKLNDYVIDEGIYYVKACLKTNPSESLAFDHNSSNHEDLSPLSSTGVKRKSDSFIFQPSGRGFASQVEQNCPQGPYFEFEKGTRAIVSGPILITNAVFNVPSTLQYGSDLIKFSFCLPRSIQDFARKNSYIILKIHRVPDVGETYYPERDIFLPNARLAINDPRTWEAVCASPSSNTRPKNIVIKDLLQSNPLMRLGDIIFIAAYLIIDSKNDPDRLLCTICRRKAATLNSRPHGTRGDPFSLPSVCAECPVSKRGESLLNSFGVLYPACDSRLETAILLGKSNLIRIVPKPIGPKTDLKLSDDLTVSEQIESGLLTHHDVVIPTISKIYTPLALGMVQLTRELNRPPAVPERDGTVPADLARASKTTHILYPKEPYQSSNTQDLKKQESLSQDIEVVNHPQRYIERLPVNPPSHLRDSRGRYFVDIVLHGELDHEVCWKLKGETGIPSWKEVHFLIPEKLPAGRYYIEIFAPTWVGDYSVKSSKPIINVAYTILAEPEPNSIVYVCQDLEKKKRTRAMRRKINPAFEAVPSRESFLNKPDGSSDGSSIQRPKTVSLFGKISSDQMKSGHDSGRVNSTGQQKVHANNNRKYITRVVIPSSPDILEILDSIIGIKVTLYLDQIATREELEMPPTTFQVATKNVSLDPDYHFITTSTEGTMLIKKEDTKVKAGSKLFESKDQKSSKKSEVPTARATTVGSFEMATESRSKDREDQRSIYIDRSDPSKAILYLRLNNIPDQFHGKRHFILVIEGYRLVSSRVYNKRQSEKYFNPFVIARSAPFAASSLGVIFDGPSSICLSDQTEVKPRTQGSRKRFSIPFTIWGDNGSILTLADRRKLNEYEPTIDLVPISEYYQSVGSPSDFRDYPIKSNFSTSSAGNLGSSATDSAFLNRAGSSGYISTMPSVEEDSQLMMAGDIHSSVCRDIGYPSSNYLDPSTHGVLRPVLTSLNETPQSCSIGRTPRPAQCPSSIF